MCSRMTKSVTNTSIKQNNVYKIHERKSGKGKEEKEKKRRMKENTSHSRNKTKKKKKKKKKKTPSITPPTTSVTIFNMFFLSM